MRLCFHRYGPWRVEGQTGEHDYFARVFGNTKECQRCGKRKRKAGYDPY